MASRTLQISEKDIRQERRIVWPSFDVCKGRNYSKGNKFYLRFPPLQKPEWRGFRGRARVSERKRRIQLRVCLRRTCLHSRGRSEAMPLRSPGDAATSLIAEADTRKCQNVKVPPYHICNKSSKGAADHSATPPIRISLPSRRSPLIHTLPEFPIPCHGRDHLRQPSQD